MTSFKNLVIWQKSMNLVKETYALTDNFPNSEIFSLASQMRYNSISIASNIAKGQKRGSVKDLVRFLESALTSSAELEAKLLIAQELYRNYNYTKCASAIKEMQKILEVLIKRCPLFKNVNRAE